MVVNKYYIYIYYFKYNTISFLIYIYIYIASRKLLPKENLNVIVTENMKDINFEEELSDGENDPELLV